VVNETTTLSINAKNCSWDEWSASSGTTQLWACSDNTYTSCICAGANCPGSGSQSTPSDADAVYLSSNTSARPIDSTLGSQAAATTCQ
jgi:hypothetical protein